MQNRKKSKLKTIFVIVFTLAVAYYLFCTYVAMMNTVHSIAQSQSEQVANEAIHYAVAQCAGQSHKYGELVNVYRNDNGEIESLSLNSYVVNALKSDISVKVLDYLNDSERYNISVPLGNFFGSEFLTGIGPKIRFRIVPFNVAQIDFENKFRQSGINQVLHSVVVKVDVKVGALLPGFEGITDVSSSAVIAETVIIGDVPETYFNVEN